MVDPLDEVGPRRLRRRALKEPAGMSVQRRDDRLAIDDGPRLKASLIALDKFCDRSGLSLLLDRVLATAKLAREGDRPTPRVGQGDLIDRADADLPLLRRPADADAGAEVATLLAARMDSHIEASAAAVRLPVHVLARRQSPDQRRRQRRRRGADSPSGRAEGGDLCHSGPFSRTHRGRTDLRISA